MKHQPFHIKDERHQIADAQATALQLGAPQAQQHEQADGGDALDQGEHHTAVAGRPQGRVPVGAVAGGERPLLHRLLSVDLDRVDARKVFLQQVGEGRQGLLLPALLAHDPPAEALHAEEHQRVEGHRRQAQPGIDQHHRRQGEAIGQHRVGEAEHGKAQQAPHVFHVAGGAAQHITAGGGLHPGGFLPQQMVKHLLLQIHLHLATHAKHEHARHQAHPPITVARPMINAAWLSTLE